MYVIVKTAIIWSALQSISLLLRSLEIVSKKALQQRDMHKHVAMLVFSNVHQFSACVFHAGHGSEASEGHVHEAGPVEPGDLPERNGVQPRRGISACHAG